MGGKVISEFADWVDEVRRTVAVEVTVAVKMTVGKFIKVLAGGLL